MGAIYLLSLFCRPSHRSNFLDSLPRFFPAGYFPLFIFPTHHRLFSSSVSLAREYLRLLPLGSLVARSRCSHPRPPRVSLVHIRSPQPRELRETFVALRANHHRIECPAGTSIYSILLLAKFIFHPRGSRHRFSGCSPRCSTAASS